LAQTARPAQGHPLGLTDLDEAVDQLTTTPAPRQQVTGEQHLARDVDRGRAGLEQRTAVGDQPRAVSGARPGRPRRDRGRRPARSRPRRRRPGPRRPRSAASRSPHDPVPAAARWAGPRPRTGPCPRSAGGSARTPAGRVVVEQVQRGVEDLLWSRRRWRCACAGARCARAGRDRDSVVTVGFMVNDSKL
jgi:hypothetical protein